VTALGPDDRAISAAFLEQALVSSLPGSAFGPGGEGHLRINFARRDPADIDEAIDRLRRASERL
jgi:aspartate/methionine/tyrosine aminotransferase